MTNEATKFQIALRVADLPRSIAFYRVLLKCEPSRVSAKSACFETEIPPLILTLANGEPRKPEDTLNHLGFRMPDQATLVDLQRRLEERGIATQRQEGVECCYALQTKFWVTDPDKHLWELYIFHADLDQSGFDDPAVQEPRKPKGQPRIWTHPLTDPIPDRLDFADGSLDEAHLDGTFNRLIDDAQKAQLLSEVHRVLCPGGMVAVHCMAADRPFPWIPKFPGIAALVQHVPTNADLTELLQKAGFVNLFFATFNGICLSVPGIELREVILRGTRVEASDSAETRYVMYRGPFDEITDDNATYRRGERVAVSATDWLNLRQGPATDQFVFFPSS